VGGAGLVGRELAMRRLVSAAVCAVLLSGLAAGSLFAAKPTKFVIDISDPEFIAGGEEQLSEDCGFAIDLEASGHIIVHQFDGHARLIEIDNYRMFQTLSANGKTVVVRPDAGPDIVWVGRDGAVYLAITGRPITGSGVIGRTVINLDTGELVSSNGNDVGDFIAALCTALAAD
jgi:hypothetical protein